MPIGAGIPRGVNTLTPTLCSGLDAPAGLIEVASAGSTNPGKGAFTPIAAGFFR